MVKLSIELIIEILSYLPQRQLAICSLVNKEWYSITRQQKYYKKIVLRTSSQIKKFIEYAQLATIDGIPLSHCVKQIIFSNNINDLKPQTLASLITLCPFVSEVNEIPISKTEDYKMISNFIFWQHLTRIPLSYSNIDSRWIDHMYKLSKSIHENDRTKITSISLNMGKKYIVVKDHNEIEQLNRLKTESEEFYKQIVLMISQSNLALPRRGNDTMNDNVPLIDFNSSYWILPSSFMHLKQIYLDFSTYNKIDRHCFYKFNEKTLDSISTTCPSLTHLTLYEFNFNMTNKYVDRTRDTSSNTLNVNAIIPSTQLQVLKLNYCYLHDPDCYTYIKHKYPNLTTLWIYIYYLPIMDRPDINFRAAIGDLITGYETLTLLYFFFLTKCTNQCTSYPCKSRHISSNSSFWPQKEFQLWLTTHPKQITELYYPFDLFTIDRLNDEDWKSSLIFNKLLPDDERLPLIFKQRDYLNHLTALRLSFEQNSNYTLTYLRYQHNNTTILASSPYFHSLKRLDVMHIHLFDWNSQQSKFQFYVYDWLNSFNSLEILIIGNLSVQHDHQTVYPFLIEQPHHMLLSTTTKLNYFQSFYQLRVLEFRNCRICFDINEMTHFLKTLPHLKTLKLKTVWFTAKPVASQFIIFAPHLNLSTLQLTNIKYEQFYSTNHHPDFVYSKNGKYVSNSHCKIYFIQNMKVIECISDTTTEEVVKSNEENSLLSDLWFTFTCRTVDSIIF